MHGWATEVIDAVGKPAPGPDGYLGVFFAASASSQRAGQETLQRMVGSRRENLRVRREIADAVADAEPDETAPIRRHT